MNGCDSRWLLLPLKRGALIAIAAGGLHLGALWVNQGNLVATSAPATLTSAANATDTRAPWPHLMLRLWILVPQVLPLSR